MKGLSCEPDQRRTERENNNMRDEAVSGYSSPVVINAPDSRLTGCFTQFTVGRAKTGQSEL